MDDKTYEPKVVDELPFPGQDVQPIVISGQTVNGDTVTPKTKSEKPIPKKRTAVELLSSALNTRSKKILQEFNFTQSGALQIGDYKQGISGDLRVSPNGLVARDIAGITTFAIDGQTGDAFFKGTVQSGSVITGSTITGDLTVGGEGNGEGQIHVLDNTNTEKVTLDKDGITINEGKMIIKDASNTTIIDATGLIGSTTFPNYSGFTETDFVTTSTTDALVDGATQTTASYDRAIPTLIIFTCTMKVEGQGGGDFEGSGRVRLYIDGSVPNDSISIARYGKRQAGEESGNGWVTLTTHYFNELSSGTHTIEMKGAIDYVGAGTPELTVFRNRLTVITLGN